MPSKTCVIFPKSEDLEAENKLANNENGWKKKEVKNMIYYMWLVVHNLRPMRPAGLNELTEFNVNGE